MKKIVALVLFTLILFPFNIYAEDYHAKIIIPTIFELPNLDYPNTSAIIWEGGEEKFGNWRNFFNGFEMGWGISYNTRWNYQNNTWEPRDSTDSRANICAMFRFNVAEGNVGGNVFEINFAPGDNKHSPPDWNAAGTFFFYDGSMPNRAPTTLMIKAAGDMDAQIKLCPNEGSAPNRVNFRAGADGGVYIEREEYGSINYVGTYSSKTTPLLTFKDNHVTLNGNLVFQSDENNAAALIVDSATGNIILQIFHNGEMRQGTIINFNNMSIVK